EHAVADVDARLLRVREELARALDVLLIHPVLDQVLDRDDHGLHHLVRHDDPDLGARVCFLRFFGGSHHVLAFPFKIVSMRAFSFRTCFIFAGDSTRPVARWKRSLKSCSVSSRWRVWSSSTLFQRGVAACLLIHPPPSPRA